MSAGWSGRTGGCEFAGEPAPGFSSEVWMGIQRLLCLWKCRRAVGDDGSPCTQHLGLGMQGSAAGMGGSSFLLLLRKGISGGDTNLRHSPVLRELSPLYPPSCCKVLPPRHLVSQTPFTVSLFIILEPRVITLQL